MKHRKLVFGLGAPLLLLVVGFFVILLPLPVLIPHHPTAIILPFAPQDDAVVSLIPMGEEIFHPNSPGGHPGIDFGGADYFNLIASMDGTVTQVLASGKNATESRYDVRIENSRYFTRYFELDSIGPMIVKGAAIEQGDLIGTPHKSIVNPGDPPHTSMHWEFGSTGKLIDRLCPMSYFDATSQQRATAMWERTPLEALQGMRQRYPDVCSGGYKDKTEPTWMVLGR